MEKNDNTGFDNTLQKPFTSKALPIMLGGTAGTLVIAAASISLVMLVTHSYFFWKSNYDRTVATAIATKGTRLVR